MPLPQLTQPIYSLTLPSTAKKIRFRPFTVKEEKLLLMVKESPDPASIADVYKQLVNNCVLDPIDVDKLAAIDVEYIFLQLRSKSVSNIAQIRIKDPDDEAMYDAEVDLDSVLIANLDCKKKFSLTDSIGVVLKWPTFNALLKISKAAASQSKAGSELIKMCLDTVWEGENLYKVSEFSHAEVDDFIDSLGVSDLAAISEFFNNLPYLYVMVKYQKKDGTPAEREVRGLQSFF